MQFETYEKYEEFIKEVFTDKMLNNLVYNFCNEKEEEAIVEIIYSYVRKELSQKMLLWLRRKFKKHNIFFISNLDYCIANKKNNESIKLLNSNQYLLQRKTDTLTIIYSYGIDEINQLNKSIIKKALANVNKAKA